MVKKSKTTHFKWPLLRLIMCLIQFIFLCGILYREIKVEPDTLPEETRSLLKALNPLDHQVLH